MRSLKLTRRGQWAGLWATAAGTVVLAVLCLPLPPAGMSLPPCSRDDGLSASGLVEYGGCSWDASEQGNGAGTDFWVTPDPTQGVCYTYPADSSLNVCVPRH